MTSLNFAPFERSKKKAYKLKKECAICGKTFTVKCNRDGLILTDCFHNYLNKHFFLGWTYEVVFPFMKEDKFDDNFKIRFKNTYYRIVGFSKLSRTIYYFVWKLFHRGKIEFWECTKCANRPDDI